jgi:hypothetical protein
VFVAETEADAGGGGRGDLGFGSHSEALRWVVKWTGAYKTIIERRPAEEGREGRRERERERETDGFAKSLRA